MNNDLISREALRKAFHERIYYFDKSSWDEANAIIDNAPTVDERSQGEWICVTKSTFPQYQPDEYKCPFCNVIVHRKTNYCEYCGAKMKGGAE